MELRPMTVIRRWSLVFLLVAATTFAVRPATAASSTEDGPSIPSDEALESLVRARMRENRTPAAVILVREAGRPVWSRGFGVDAGGDPVDPETPFGIGSISKGVTGVVVASLIHEGTLDLAARVESLLPALREPSTPASHRDITLRHLVFHTSGLDVRGEHLFVDEPPLERARSVWRRPLVRPPGDAFEYVNTNYLILGMVVESVTGRSFEEVVHDRVFGFLGREEPGTAAPAPAHQLWFGRPIEHESTPVESPASGGLVANARELADLVEALGRNGRVGEREALDPAVIRLATTPGVRIDDERGYAMGWYRRPVAGVPTLSHGGSTPGYSAFALHQEDDERTVVILTNAWGAIWGSQTPIWIAADVVRLFEGEDVPDRTGAAGSYRWLNLIVLVALALTARTAWKLRGKPSALAALPSGWERRKRTLPSVAWHLATAAAVAWLVPLWARFSLRSFLAVPSDVSVLLILGIASGVAFAVAELGVLRAAARGDV